MLLSLLGTLFLFTDFSNKLYSNDKNEEYEKYLFYLFPDMDLSHQEKLFARKLAKINNLKFVEIKPIATLQFLKILSDIKYDNNFNKSTLDYNLSSYLENLRSWFTDSRNSLTYDEPVDEYYRKHKEFLRWLTGIKNFKTSIPRITPYDDIIKRYARELGIDWRLIAAQMFFESSYKPYSRSFAGAKGLMQLTPIAMRELGLKNPYHIENNILAGIKYLKSRYEFFKNFNEESRLNFALASYNAGIGHVHDAQRLAKFNGLNPKKWEEVSEMLLDLKYFDDSSEQIKHGYCRGSETVAYVNNVVSRYNIYKTLIVEN